MLQQQQQQLLIAFLAFLQRFILNPKFCFAVVFTNAPLKDIFIFKKKRDRGRGTLIFCWLTFCAIVTVEGDEKKPNS